MSKHPVRFLSVVALIVGSCGIAAADPIGLNLDSVTVNGTKWDYNYSLTLSGPPPATNTKEQMLPGDFVSVLDFLGFSGVAAPANWSASTELTTTLPLSGGLLVSTDSPAITNVKFTLKTPIGGITGPLTVSGFVITSDFRIPKLGNFGTSYESDSGNVGGPLHPADGVVPTLVPTPEPWNAVSALAMIVPLGLLYRGLRRAKVSSLVPAEVR